MAKIYTLKLARIYIGKGGRVQTAQFAVHFSDPKSYDNYPSYSDCAIHLFFRYNFELICTGFLPYKRTERMNALC